MCSRDTALSSRTARKRRSFPRAEDTAKPFLSTWLMDVDCQWDVQQLGERWESQKEEKQRFHAIPIPWPFRKNLLKLRYTAWQWGMLSWRNEAVWSKKLHFRIRRVDPAAKLCHLRRTGKSSLSKSKPSSLSHSMPVQDSTVGNGKDSSWW